MHMVGSCNRFDIKRTISSTIGGVSIAYSGNNAGRSLAVSRIRQKFQILTITNPEITGTFQE
jgi:hypothetical protein